MFCRIIAQLLIAPVVLIGVLLSTSNASYSAPLTLGDWDMHCEQSGCFLLQRTNSAGYKSILLLMLAEGSERFRGALLVEEKRIRPMGVTFSIDGQTRAHGAFEKCSVFNWLPNTLKGDRYCPHIFELKSETARMLRNGNAASFAVESSDGAKITFNYSLVGITDGLIEIARKPISRNESNTSSTNSDSTNQNRRLDEDFHTAKCRSSTAKCFKTAAKKCGGSYSVIESHSNSGGLLADIIPGPFTWYNMTFVCGPNDGARPTFPFNGYYLVPTPSQKQPDDLNSKLKRLEYENCVLNNRATGNKRHCF